MSLSAPLAADPATMRVTINDQAANPGFTVSNHTAEDQGSRRSNRQSDTANGARGVLSSGQNNGSNNGLNSATGVQLGGSDGTVSTRGAVGASTVLHFGSGTPGVRDRANILDGSLTGFRGIATIQQNNGDGNDIGAATGVLVDLTDTRGASHSASTDGLVELDAFSDVADTGSVRRNTVSGSLDGARGIATIQQNNGSANALGVSNTVGVTAGATTLNQQALSLGMVDSQAALYPILGQGAERGNRLSGSLAGAQGLFTLQQNNGDGNVLGAANAVSAHVGGTALDEATQTVQATSSLLLAYTRQGAGNRSNATDGTAAGAAGVVNLQQNNGDGNAVTVANGINATLAGVGYLTSQVGAATHADSGDTIGVGAGVPGHVDRVNAATRGTANGAKGVVTIQQNNGDTNGMAAASGVHATGDSEVSRFRVGGAAAATWIGTIDMDSERRNRITGSFSNAQGLIGVQQNNGDSNAMSMASGVAVQLGAGDLEQTADASSTISGGVGFFGEPPNQALGGRRANGVSGSFQSSQGLMAVQQNNGNGNSLNAATSLAAGLGDGDNGTATQTTLAGAGSAFGSTLDGSSPYVAGGGGRRTNSVSGGSFDGARGIAGVQQNNGSNNALGVASSLSADRGARAARQSSTTAAAEVFSNVATAVRDGTTAAPDRHNAIDGSFTGFRGVATVQQNNGDGNAMAAATGLTASRNGDATERRQAVAADANVVNPLSPLTQTGVASANGVTGGFDGAAGLVTVQQNTGNGNAVTAATAIDAGPGGLAEQTATSKGAVGSVIADSDGATRDNRIERSFTGARGILTVQQNAGDGNALGVANGLMVGTGSGADDSTASADLAVDGQTGFVEATDTLRSNGAGGLRGARTNTLDRAFNNASGVATAQQNAGSGNAVNSGTLVQTDARGGKRSAQAAVRSKGAVADNRTTQDGASVVGTPGRANTVTDSFGAFRGVATVQQNGGDGNVIGAGTAVTATRNPASPTEAGARIESALSVERSEALQNVRTEHRNTITNTANGAAGILSIQQNTGNNNAMSASNAVAAVNGQAGLGSAVNVATLAATVADNRSVAAGAGSLSTNQASGSLQGVRGLTTLQQNNGHNNAMQSAIAVTATY